MKSASSSDNLGILPWFCLIGHEFYVLTCKMVKKTKKHKIVWNPTQKQLQQIYKQPRASKPRSSSKTYFNLFSSAFAIIIFLTFLQDANAEYLCGSQLVDTLRYICGKRGIYVPTHSRYKVNRGYFGRHRGGSHGMTITHRCCHLGCNYNQLQDYCGNNNVVTTERQYQNVELTTLRVEADHPSTTSQTITQPRAALTTTAFALPGHRRSTEALVAMRRKRPTFRELENRYESILVENIQVETSSLAQTRHRNKSKNYSTYNSKTSSESSQSQTRKRVIKAILSLRKSEN